MFFLKNQDYKKKMTFIIEFWMIKLGEDIAVFLSFAEGSKYFLGKNKAK